MILERGARALDVEVPREALELLAQRAGGDAGAALQILELATATAAPRAATLAEEHVVDASRKRPLLYDRKGDQHYDFASAFIKSMRGGDADASVYYLAAMLEAGEDPRFIARRMVILASEDVGNADPNALVVAVAAAQALEHVGLPEAQLNLSQAAIYLARAPKSNASAVAIWEARRDVREHGNARPPAMLRSTGHKAPRRRGVTARATSIRTTIRAGSTSRTSRRSFADGGTIGRPERERSRWMAVRTGEAAPEFDLEVEPRRARAAVRLPRPLERPPRLPPLRVHPGLRGRGARPAGEPAVVPRRGHRDRLRLMRPAPAARAGVEGADLGAEYTFASDFWPHGAAAKAYGVFNEANGAPHRGYVPDRPRGHDRLVAA